MENTTFNSYKTLVFITKEFDYQINFKVLKDEYIIRANYKLIDYDLLMNELSTYNNNKEQKKLLNTIYNFANNNIKRYNDSIIHLTDIDSRSYYIQRENNFTVKTGKENEAYDNFMKEPPLKNEYEYIQNYTNSDFINYCKVIIDYIDEMQPKKEKVKAEVKKDLTLKDIVHSELWEKLNNYLALKTNIPKNQYRNLFETMRFNGYTKPEYFGLSIDEMKIIILNHFKVDAKESMKERKNIKEKQKNLFSDMPKIQTLMRI